MTRLKRPPRRLQEGNSKHHRPASALCFLREATPISYATLPEKPCGQDIFVTEGCQAEQVVGQLPLHSRDYMKTVSRFREREAPG